MAHDKTPPRSGIIIFFAVLSALTLIGLEPVFTSYFSLTDLQEHIKKVNEDPGAELESYKAEVQQQLHQGPMPIDRAMEQIGRSGRGAAAIIQPQPSDNLAPLTGWNQLPDPAREAAARKAEEEAAARKAAAEAAAAAAAAADGGVPAAPEPGATPQPAAAPQPGAAPHPPAPAPRPLPGAGNAPNPPPASAP